MALNYVKGIISHMGEIQQGTSQGGFDWVRQTLWRIIGNSGLL